MNDDLIDICEAITRENRSLKQWAKIESHDMFRAGDFVGGFDAAEGEFTFSYYDSESKEWWFQISLHTAQLIASGGNPEIWAGRAR